MQGCGGGVCHPAEGGGQQARAWRAKGPVSEIVRTLPLSCQNRRRSPQPWEGINGRQNGVPRWTAPVDRARKRTVRRSALGGVRALDAYRASTGLVSPLSGEWQCPRRRGAAARAPPPAAARGPGGEGRGGARQR